MTRDAVVAEARTWLGTPFHHQGRLRGVGTDCVGVVMGLARHCGLEFEDDWRYNKQAEGFDLSVEFGRLLERIPLEEAAPADVLTFWFRDPTHVQHCGVLTPYGLLHTYGGVGRVVEHALDDRWARRRNAAFRLPGVS